MSKKDGSAVLQEVICNALSSYDLYDEVPETAPMPYLRIGENSVESYDSCLCFSDFISIQIDAFSNYRGFKEIKELISDIKSVLSEIDEKLKGFSVRFLRFDSINFERGEDCREATITATFLVSQEE